MSTPRIARLKPYLVQVEEGRRYMWCACGRSKNQPFCDGSHKGTGFMPLAWTATATEERLFCACKRSSGVPFCDGTHNSLSDTYAEADPDEGADVRVVEYEPAEGGALQAPLDNGCYVLRMPETAVPSGEMPIYPVISRDHGAKHLSQYVARVHRGSSPILRFPGSDAILFVEGGNGTVKIADRSFPVAPETGVCIKPGEAFQVRNPHETPISLSISVCPPCGGPEYPERMPPDFDESVPDRVQGVDESKQEAMADRFFQVLIGDKSHGTPVTQFIGKIPQSRAAHHRHIYEEAITILDGEGYMWTNTTKTPVRPGDIIFLPLKQEHSLECTTAGGMRLVGLFYPSMSPAINY